MEELYTSERFVPLLTFALGYFAPDALAWIADGFKKIRPGKTLYEIQDTLSLIAEKMERLEDALSKKGKAKKPSPKVASSKTVQHINGAAQTKVAENQPQ